MKRNVWEVYKGWGKGVKGEEERLLFELRKERGRTENIWKMKERNFEKLLSFLRIGRMVLWYEGRR